MTEEKKPDVYDVDPAAPLERIRKRSVDEVGVLTHKRYAAAQRLAAARLETYQGHVPTLEGALKDVDDKLRAAQEEIAAIDKSLDALRFAKGFAAAEAEMRTIASKVHAIMEDKTAGVIVGVAPDGALVRQEPEEWTPPDVDELQRYIAAMPQVLEALGPDAAGRPLADLLTDAGQHFATSGGGPLGDCLLYKAQQVVIAVQALEEA